ncbi:hypothetical protein FB390_4363 [Nocardia bhagyanarayanae]|uniref:Uncharacterized protein n=1 Tax=Nocardia bhagyanarayanae TaxID=1215925 RepID=A0A543FFL9_9NOCA|nr:hypothetical protein FB390_4363 [Nocardia bhagyanarayanae]
MDPFAILGLANGVLSALSNGVYLVGQVLSLVLPFI